jgi:hypothetical protein
MEPGDRACQIPEPVVIEWDPLWPPSACPDMNMRRQMEHSCTFPFLIGVSADDAGASAACMPTVSRAAIIAMITTLVPVFIELASVVFASLPMCATVALVAILIFLLRVAMTGCEGSMLLLLSLVAKRPMTFSWLAQCHQELGAR